MNSPLDARANDRSLDAEIELFFRMGGYTTDRRVVADGRSGGRHEIDVLAQRCEGVAPFLVMVDCRAWRQPIERDAVEKASFVADDLGIDRAIVVSLAGCQLAAREAAQELGIDLWYPFEIEQRLGKSVVEAIRAGGA